MTKKSEVLRKWQLLSPYLHRKQQIVWAATEAEGVGARGCQILASVTSISIPTLTKWIDRLQLTATAPAGSLIPPKGSVGSGRRLTEVNDPKLEPALQQMLLEETAGDPMGPQKWARSSLRKLSKRLGDQGHQACTHTVARLLRKMGYSLQVAKRKQAGAHHPDRDEQFKYIAALKAQFLRENLPVISIDTKKKELIGNYRREGKTWRKEPFEVDSYFASYAQCVAVPFGIYDVAQNVGYVTVGISHNTAEFAVNCLVNWWKLHGRSAYAHADRVLILADGGGGNGYNLRTWKKDLQDRLCNAFGLTVTLT